MAIKWPLLKLPPINLWILVSAREWYKMSDAMTDYRYEKEAEQQTELFNEIDMMNQAADSVTNDVVKDLRDREQKGRTKYGKYLTANTDEDMLQHLYEELLDAACYIKNEINKRKKNG